MSHITRLTFASSDQSVNEDTKPIIIEIKSGLTDSDVTDIITSFFDKFWPSDVPASVLAIQVSKSNMLVTVPDATFMQWYIFTSNLRDYLRDKREVCDKSEYPVMSRKEAREAFARRIINASPFSNN